MGGGRRQLLRSGAASRDQHEGGEHKPGGGSEAVWADAAGFSGPKQGMGQISHELFHSAEGIPDFKLGTHALDDPVGEFCGGRLTS